MTTLCRATLLSLYLATRDGTLIKHTQSERLDYLITNRFLTIGWKKNSLVFTDLGIRFARQELS